MSPTTPLLVRVEQADFDTAQLQRELRQGRAEEGAIATFTGYVRADNEQRPVASMELEHYPGMTEKCIEDILQQAAQRWQLIAATVVHRVGILRPAEQIVWVGVASAHRGDAFSACEFVMDYLKTQAPFWKKEVGPGGERWVEARSADEQRAQQWREQE